jgi:hypothetical protein
MASGDETVEPAVSRVDDKDMSALCADIVRFRRNGATCEICHRNAGTALDAADAIAQLCDFTPLGDRWREIDLDMARMIIVHVLSHDLAYATRLNTDSLAADYADRFLATLGTARYLTNGDDPRLRTGGWDPITSATFDGGVVAVGVKLIGIVWVEDED